MSDSEAFYNDMADDYHLIFADWSRSMERQGTALDALIRHTLKVPDPVSVLDVSCGIGTQSIALAARGYRVHGTDLSSGAVQRASEEVIKRGLKVEFSVADMRSVGTVVRETFDVVLSCDNSVAHLLHEEDLITAAMQMSDRLHPHGLALVSLRDYDAVILERPRTQLPWLAESHSGTTAVVQIWDWDPIRPEYLLHHLTLREGTEWTVAHRSVPMRAWLRTELEAAFRTAGFTSLSWHMPETSGYYQPLLAAVKSTSS